MLDSSPVAFHPTTTNPIIPPRPLKRSASSASLASLPTPPRTHRKHARGRSRGSVDNDTDSAEELVAVDSSDDEVVQNLKDKGKETGGQSRYKRRRTQEGGAAKDEEAFWLAEPTKDSARQTRSGALLASGSSTSTAPLLYRKRQAQAQSQSQAPVSPPPSNRKLNIPALSLNTPPVSAASPPKTPRTRSETRAASVAMESPPGLMDSPGNPFLDTPVKERERRLGMGKETRREEGEGKYVEKPMMSYVFRGVRRSYPNPMWNHAENRPRSPPPTSLLPIDHPEYSPPVHATPKLLFPEARMRGAPKKKGGKLKFMGSGLTDSEDEDHEDVGQEIKPTKLDFGRVVEKRLAAGKASGSVNAKQMGKTATTSKVTHKKKLATLDQEFREVGERLSA
ncbi:hypothetical protein BJ165DRAFT_298990 [Panaeolus papilionaceus]|nr:hypothetical protein BJ165DRAFT_298990 [Panaeolus papilionaceus]